MALVCGIDVETTGLDPQHAEVIEVGAVLWDTEEAKPVEIVSQLLMPELGITEEITALTGITEQDLQQFGKHFLAVWPSVLALMARASAIVAHNGNHFDRPFITEVCTKKALPLPDLPWIDTMLDVPYPDGMKTRKLCHLAAEHGFLNPFAHRAVFDVLTMLRIMAFYDFATVLASAMQPSIVVQAMCKKPWEDDGASTTEAKQNGFHWDGKVKKWQKQIKQNQLEKEQAKASLYQVQPSA